MINEFNAEYIHKLVRSGEHELHEVSVRFEERSARYTAIRAKLRETHPDLVVTNNWYGTHPAFLNERKQPDGSYKITVLTHKRKNRQSDADSLDCVEQNNLEVV